MHRVADCIIWRVIPKPPEWKRVGDEIDAAIIFAEPDLVNVHRDGKRFVVRADELPTAFLELQRAIHEFAVHLMK